MKVEITLTWSKLMALLVLIYAFVMDIRVEEGHTALIYVVPFVVIMIGAKQAMDLRKKDTENK